MFKFCRIVLICICIKFSTFSYAVGAVIGLVDTMTIPSSAGGGQNQPTGILFNPDGTNMYIIGNASGKKIFQYSLTTPFDISEATLESGECSVGGGDKPLNAKFNNDGTKLYLAETNGDTVDIYKLTTSYDITTCEKEGEQDFGGSLEVRDISFSSNGKKIFIFDAPGSTSSVKQYSLSAPFDLTNPILERTHSGLEEFNLFEQGLAFSSDGTKMFISGNKDPDVINEFTLSTPFDLSNVKHNGPYNVSGDITHVSAISFSNDGTKMFLTDFNSGDRLVLEYDLNCGFGVIECIDPTSNKDDVAMVEAQSESSKQIIQHTTYPVLNRMNWLRRNENQTNLSSQNIRLNFSNEFLNLLSKSLMPNFTSSVKKNNIKQSHLDWSFWSEGSVSVGKIGDTSSSSFKDINTTGVTIGADKKYYNNVTKGFAINFSSDDVDIGHLGSGLNSKSGGFTFYTSRPKGENKYFDTLIGLNLLSMNITNNSGTSSTKGDREGEQIFGSFNLSDKYETIYLNIYPNIKLNYGATYLSKYKEVGDGIKLEFGDQIIGTLISSVGSSFDKKIKINNGIFVPFLDFEYSADISPSSKQSFNYASKKDKNYTIRNINNSTHNIHGGIGFDLNMDSGLVLVTKYQRNQAIGSGYTNNFIIGIDYNNLNDELYTMSFKNYDFNFSHQRMLNKFNLNIDSNYNPLKTNPDYGFYVKLSNRF